MKQRLGVGEACVRKSTHGPLIARQLSLSLKPAARQPIERVPPPNEASNQFKPDGPNDPPTK